MPEGRLMLTANQPAVLHALSESSPLRRMKRSQNRGFTLIELLVVIAIIALLIGILLPALGKARNSARTMKCLSNTKSMGTSLALYANEYKAWFPNLPVGSGNPGDTEADADREDAGHNKPRYSKLGQYGGLAGFFTLNQQGQADPTATTDPARCYVRKRFNAVDPFYSDRKTQPVLHRYMDGFGALVCPSDKEDRRYAYHVTSQPNSNVSYEYTLDPAANSSYIPKVPGKADEICGYNLSYMYYVGMKADEPNVVSAVPIWGDETNGPDMGVSAFYANGGDTPSKGYQAAGARARNFYGKVDNHGRDGGNWLFSDGHGEFITTDINKTFFDTDLSKAINTARNINAINPYRSRWIAALD